MGGSTASVLFPVCMTPCQQAVASLSDGCFLVVERDRLFK